MANIVSAPTQITAKPKVSKTVKNLTVTLASSAPARPTLGQVWPRPNR